MVQTPDDAPSAPSKKGRRLYWFLFAGQAGRRTQAQVSTAASTSGPRPTRFCATSDESASSERRGRPTAPPDRVPRPTRKPPPAANHSPSPGRRRRRSGLAQQAAKEFESATLLFMTADGSCVCDPPGYVVPGKNNPPATAAHRRGWQRTSGGPALRSDPVPLHPSQPSRAVMRPGR